jgi:acyl-CoA dehydrogenase
MSLELTDEQKDIRRAAREFAQGEFPNVAAECDEQEKFPREVWKKACGLGLIGVYIKEEYGGAGLGCLEHCLVMEEFWRVDPGCGNILLTTFGAECLQKYGTNEQKRKFIPPLPRGEAISAVAITEPDAGSDVTAIQTRADKQGMDYVIRGNKIFISNGTIADYVLVVCMTNPEATSRLDRFSFILVETDREGFEATKMTGKMGIRASDTAEIVFSDVRVPQGNLVGQEGKGFYQLMDLFNLNRTFAAAQGVGVAQGALEKSIQHVKQRHQFGKPIASFQVTQFKIAEMATMIEAARGLYYRACLTVDQGKPDPKLISMAKWYAGEVGVKVTDMALQLHGGYGYMKDYDIQRFYRDAKVVEIYEGTKDIEKMVIARELLGNP